MDCDEEINETVKNDSDLNSLMSSLASLNTNEKDDLVINFQNIANELSYTTARFFLEMNNWWERNVNNVSMTTHLCLTGSFQSKTYNSSLFLVVENNCVTMSELFMLIMLIWWSISHKIASLITLKQLLAHLRHNITFSRFPVTWWQILFFLDHFMHTACWNLKFPQKQNGTRKFTLARISQNINDLFSLFTFSPLSRCVCS